VELLTEAVVENNMQNDSTIWEMLAMAYFEAHRTNPSVSTDYLIRSAECFNRVIEMGVTKDYMYSNLYTIYYELGDYAKAEEALAAYEDKFPDDYIPHALRSMMYITIENKKAQSTRDYTKALGEFNKAGDKLSSDEDPTYYQQLKSLVDELYSKGWVSSSDEENVSGTVFETVFGGSFVIPEGFEQVDMGNTPGYVYCYKNDDIDMSICVGEIAFAKTDSSIEPREILSKDYQYFLDSYGDRVTYNVAKDDFFVISGYMDEETIFYNKSMNIGDKAYINVEFEYNNKNRDICDNILTDFLDGLSYA